MKKTLIIIFLLMLALITTSVYAYRMSKPRRITDFDERNLVILNDTLESLWDITNGRMTEFDDDVTLSGNAKVTQYRWMHAGAAGVGGANPATEDVNDLGFVVLEFADAADDYAQVNVKVPVDMDLSADSYICVGWSVPNTSANMTWGYGYLATAVNEDTQPASATTGTQVVTSSATADGLNVSTIITIPGDTFTTTTVCIHVYVYRDVSEDTYGAEVDLHGMAFKYTADKLGEQQ